MKAKVYGLINEKGGVGKSTTAATTAYVLAKQGKKVLLIDFDGQGHASLLCGVPNINKLPTTTATLMNAIIDSQPLPEPESYLHHHAGVNLIPSNSQLFALERNLSNADFRETKLAELVDTLRDNYDYILIDCMPKVSVSGRKLVVEAKFPYDMLNEPEDYEIEVTLEDSKSKETAVFTVKGTVYWQDSDAPVSPDEYREKKYVVVDFDGNDGEDIDFQNGRIRTDGLKSGVANLDVSYSGTSVDCDGLDLYTVNFLAAPRLDRSVTVCLDADEGNCVYQVSSGGKLTKLDATYNKSAGELRFETRKLGEYVVTEKELKQEDSEKKTDSASSATDTKKDTNNQKDTGKENASSSTEKNPDTGAYGEGGKTVPNTGCFEKPNPNTGAYPLF